MTFGARRGGALGALVRRALLLSAAACALAGCGDDDDGRPVPLVPGPPPAPPPGPPVSRDGFVLPAVAERQRLGYLAFATTTGDSTDPVDTLARLERARREPSYAAPRLGPEAWDKHFARLDDLEDGRDFTALYLLHVLFGDADAPSLDPALVAKIEASLLNFKFWYTEPTAPGKVDGSFYWSENHEVIYEALEYLMGQRYPDRAFGNDGRTGAEHRDGARERLSRWFDLRARFGFSEWHSNVYYQKNATALLTLAEYADEPAVRDRAAGLLDVLLLDVGTHSQRGAFGATRGRSYKKDKNSSLDEDTFALAKLVFDAADYPYQLNDAGAALFARARRYRVPEAVYRAGRDPAPAVVRERHGAPLDEAAPPSDNPPAPEGLSFGDPRDVTFWWSMGANLNWQVLPLTFATMNQYDLWQNPSFAPYAALKDFENSVPVAQAIVHGVSTFLALGLLSEVNTYAYRGGGDYLLSSAQDWRKGRRSNQAHAWQATLDARALVFTTHPATPPVASTDWRDDEQDFTGYWTGEASMPRSGQFENVAVHIYSPAYPPENGALFEDFKTETYTHAYFPQDYFDEVVQAAGWTFGRLGGGYVALYSHRPAEWLTYDPAVYATRGMARPFDLRAPGGADNLWLVECGREADYGSFEAFVAAVSAARVDVTVEPADPWPRRSVRYESPSKGLVEFGWEGPLRVAGAEVPLAGYPRAESPWAGAAAGSRRFDIKHGGYGVRVDFAAGTREVYAPPSP
ncbi:MAG TPA: hypothetical protein VFS43_11425 [Polyangiaceae bacterium]|nr:hypothetical protein [Polyangiaceae bacterium]